MSTPKFVASKPVQVPAARPTVDPFERLAAVFDGWPNASRSGSASLQPVSDTAPIRIEHEVSDSKLIVRGEIPSVDGIREVQVPLDQEKSSTRSIPIGRS